MNVTNELANKLLTLYADDDTSKVKQMTESMNLAWANIKKRWASVQIFDFSVSPASGVAYNILPERKYLWYCWVWK